MERLGDIDYNKQEELEYFFVESLKKFLKFHPLNSIWLIFCNGCWKHHNRNETIFIIEDIIQEIIDKEIVIILSEWMALPNYAQRNRKSLMKLVKYLYKMKEHILLLGGNSNFYSTLLDNLMISS